MEMAITVMMALGIFVGIPAAIGFATAGWFVYKEMKVRKAHAQTANRAGEIKQAA
jgi:hypothetical protein